MVYWSMLCDGHSGRAGRRPPVCFVLPESGQRQTAAPDTGMVGRGMVGEKPTIPRLWFKSENDNYPGGTLIRPHR